MFRRTDGTVDGRPGQGRGRLSLVSLLFAAVIVAVAAFFVGRSVRSPAQLAASARAPAPSLLTAPVRLVRPAAKLVLRGTLTDGHEISVGAPSDLGTSLPVVTAAYAGSPRVTAGSVLAAVAGRPVIVLPGSLPAYRTMSPGESGVDITQLQRALGYFGFSVWPDHTGVYGAGTARAVAALYARAGYAPTTVTITLPGSGGPSKHHKPLVEHLASVPLGEVAYIPTLPAVMTAGVRAGDTLKPNQAVARLGSGSLTVSVKVSATTASFLHVGQVARAFADVSNRSFRMRLSALSRLGTRAFRVTFAPFSGDTGATVGESVAIYLRSSLARGKHLVVPVAALVTNARADSFVVVLDHGQQHWVAVKAANEVQGAEAVTPERTGALHVGEQVVIGIGAR